MLLAHISLLIIVVVLGTCAINDDMGHLQVVYVSNNGLDNPSCGSEQSPCRHLSVGVEKVMSNGTIRVNGTQTLNKTISIRKHVRVIGIKNTETIIKGNASFAFELATKSNIQLVSMYCGMQSFLQ